MASKDKREPLGPATIADPLLGVAAGDRFGNLNFTRQFLAEFMARVDSLRGMMGTLPRPVWEERMRALIDEYATAAVGRDERYPIIDGWHNWDMLAHTYRIGPYEPMFDWAPLIKERGWPDNEVRAWIILDWLVSVWLSALAYAGGNREKAGEIFKDAYELVLHLLNGSYEVWEAEFDKR